jgi:exodeoxyribonuclease-3
VAILAKGTDPVEVRRGLPGDPDDTHSRYIEGVVGDVVIGCLYLPNGNPQPGPKFDYKLRWLDRLIKHARKLYSCERPVILAGDYNVVPTDFDIYDPKSWRKDALLQPDSRAAFERLLAQGWTDCLRARHPEERIYTFWDYFRDHWARNCGLRIDHLLVNRELQGRLVDANVDRDVRGQPRASDHAPVWIELADTVSGTAAVPKRARSVARKTGAAKATLARRKPLKRPVRK